MSCLPLLSGSFEGRQNNVLIGGPASPLISEYLRLKRRRESEARESKVLTGGVVCINFYLQIFLMRLTIVRVLSLFLSFIKIFFTFSDAHWNFKTNHVSLDFLRYLVFF